MSLHPQIYFDRRTECDCTVNIEFLLGRVYVGEFQYIPCQFSETSRLAAHVQGTVHEGTIGNKRYAHIQFSMFAICQ